MRTGTQKLLSIEFSSHAASRYHAVLWYANRGLIPFCFPLRSTDHVAHSNLWKALHPGILKHSLPVVCGPGFVPMLVCCSSKCRILAVVRALFLGGGGVPELSKEKWWRKHWNNRFWNSVPLCPPWTNALAIVYWLYTLQWNDLLPIWNLCDLI